MSDKKLIAVVGGTGSQGGGLVRAILEDPAREFRVRGPDPQRAVRGGARPCHRGR